MLATTRLRFAPQASSSSHSPGCKAATGSKSLHRFIFWRF